MDNIQIIFDKYLNAVNVAETVEQQLQHTLDIDLDKLKITFDESKNKIQDLNFVIIGAVQIIHQIDDNNNTNDNNDNENNNYTFVMRPQTARI